MLLLVGCRTDSSRSTTPGTSTAVVPAPEHEQAAPLLRVFETGRDDARDLQLLYELGLPMLMSDGTLYGLEVGNSRSMVYRQVLVESLETDRMEQLRDLVAVTGLDDTSLQELQNPTDSDYLTTTVVFTEGGISNRLSVPGIGPDDVERGDMVGTVARLIALLQPSSESVDFTPEVLSAYATPSSAPDQPLHEVWPLTTPFAEMPEVGAFGFERWRCAPVAGEEVAKVIDLLQDEPIDTVWEAKEGAFSLVVRPLLPGEEPCTGIPEL